MVYVCVIGLGPINQNGFHFAFSRVQRSIPAFKARFGTKWLLLIRIWVNGSFPLSRIHFMMVARSYVYPDRVTITGSTINFNVTGSRYSCGVFPVLTVSTESTRCRLAARWDSKSSKSLSHFLDLFCLWLVDVSVVEGNSLCLGVESGSTNNCNRLRIPPAVRPWCDASLATGQSLLFHKHTSSFLLHFFPLLGGDIEEISWPVAIR